MANVDPLPPPIDRVEAPSYFYVSRVSREVRCDLRLVLSSTSGTPTLPVHPSAEIGRLFHELIERAIRGRIPRSGSSEDDARRELRKLLAEAEERLRKKKATRRYARLSETTTPLRWRREANRAVKTAASWLEGSSRGSGNAERERNRDEGGGTSGGLTYRDLGDAGRWTEVSIRDEELRLAGRMDLVEKSGGTVVIRDFKTGRVTDGSGEVRTHLKRQLRLYGLMAKRATPTADVELIVEGGREHAVSFDREALSETEARVRDLISRLPEGRTYSAAELARPGPECATCPHRHVCGAYLKTAPDEWRGGTSYPLPPDVGGTVENVTVHSDDSVDMALRDEAGRRVKVFDLDREYVRAVREDTQLWFFGLRFYPRSHDENRWRHPLNFFEMSREEPTERAWALRVYEKPRVDAASFLEE